MTSESNRLDDARATSSIARSNASAFAADGFANPVILRTYWLAAARISSSVAGGSKLKSGLMFLHMSLASLAGNVIASTPVDESL